MRFTAALALTCALVAAPGIAAGNASADPSWCDGVACVPYVAGNVSQGAPCVGRTRYDFGLDASGGTLLCANVGKWAASRPLVGVRPLGAPCYGSDGAAQSPDGIPMVCAGQGWNENYNEFLNTPAA
jgi:hypothetical protein